MTTKVKAPTKQEAARIQAIYDREHVAHLRDQCDAADEGARGWVAVPIGELRKVLDWAEFGIEARAWRGDK